MSGSTLVPIAVAAIAVFAAYRLAGTWIRFRGARVIACPENHEYAGVRVDAGRAAVSALASAPQLRLSECTRWPEKQNCGQECLRQIRESPEDCLVRNILVRWYEGKACALCGKAIGSIAAADAKPALLVGETTMEWSEVAPGRLHEALAGARPVCFSCHAATSFVRRRPDLAIDRSQRV